MNNLYNYKLDHWQDFLKHCFDHQLTLRNHYETMTNFGATVQIGLLAGILTWNFPCTRDILCLSTHYLIATLFFLFWLLLHILIRWQLRNRRYASLQYNAVDSALRNWAMNPPTWIDLELYKPSTNNTDTHSQVFLDLLIPYLSKIKNESEKLKKSYPQELAAGWNENEEIWVKPLHHAECMYFVGSVLILFVGLFWICIKC